MSIVIALVSFSWLSMADLSSSFDRMECILRLLADLLILSEFACLEQVLVVPSYFTVPTDKHEFNVSMRQTEFLHNVYS